jgi:tRNA pseudouridine55 synthase
MIDGILLVDKPAGYTSHDIVAIVKRAYHLKKVGHTGTLDPLATGVLPLCINGATKYAGDIINSDKGYEVTLRWGTTTDTYDSLGAVVYTRSVPEDMDTRLCSLLPELVGRLQQTPPPYSAVKVDGRPLYWWTRKGIPKTVEAREITVYCADILSSLATDATLRIRCSKGTFIRSLVHDMGKRIGCGAHITALRRIQSGDFRVEDTISLDEIKKAAPCEAALCKWLIPLEKISYPRPAR